MEVEASSRRRQVTAVKQTLREVGLQLSLLGHQATGRLALKGNDLDCLEIIARHGSLAPSELARQAGLHPATVTGVLDRLERGGFVVRERDPADRRGVIIQPQRDRYGDVFQVFSGMNRAMDEVCGSYTAAELALIADFLNRTAAAGRTAVSNLAQP